MTEMLTMKLALTLTKTELRQLKEARSRRKPGRTFR